MGKNAPPSFLADKLPIFEVTAGAAKGSAVWAGGERPKQERDPKQQKLDTEFLECAFEGNLDGVKAALEQGADPYAVDGRTATALSEAATNNKIEVVKYLMDNYKLSNPNAVGHDGRSPLHRAAFHNHVEMLSFLLEAGGDPRIKSRSGETPFDLASNEEAGKILTEWDVTKTDKFLEERTKMVEIEEGKLVQNDEERKRLENTRKFAKLQKLIVDNEAALLDIEMVELSGNMINTFRDPKGMTLLHVAVELNKQEIVELLTNEENKAQIDPRDGKGWTPLMIAAFRGHKKICVYLMEKGADPELMNAHHKSCIDCSKDDEIKQLLLEKVNTAEQLQPPRQKRRRMTARRRRRARQKLKEKLRGGDEAAGSGAKAAKALAKEAPK